MFAALMQSIIGQRVFSRFAFPLLQKDSIRSKFFGDSASRGQGHMKDKNNHHQQHRQGDEDRGVVFGGASLAAVISTTQIFKGSSKSLLSSMFPVRAMAGL